MLINCPEDPLQRHHLALKIERAQAALRAATDAALLPLGLTTPQYSVFNALASSPELSNAELARECSVTPQTMIRVVEHLERKGLLEREAHPTHRRVRNVSMTLRGMRLADRCHAAVAAAESRMVRAITKDEASTLEDLLGCCINALE